jgi:hypothetical protein
MQVQKKFPCNCLNVGVLLPSDGLAHMCEQLTCVSHLNVAHYMEVLALLFMH